MSQAAIILAGGKGTRMKSDLPKVLHEVCGQPMVAYVMDACRQAGCDKLIMVVGHQADRVKDVFSGQDADVAWVLQEPQLGTGHAVMVCQDELADLTGEVLVVAGDGPLLTADTLTKLLQTHRDESAACTLATSILDEPGAYGRIVRDEQGNLREIVEALEATDAQKQIQEVNVSLYCFDAAALRDVLGKLTNDNAKGEYYLTDALGILRSEGKTLAAVPAVPAEEVLSINDRHQLAEVNRIMAERASARGGQA